MNQTVEVPINRFEILNINPSCFDYIAPKENYLDKGDTLTIKEVDSLGVPTGNVIFGEVLFVDVGIPQLENRIDAFYYICKVTPTEGIGFSIIESTFIVG